MKYIVVIEKIGDCETDITKAEYDRLLAVEAEYGRIGTEYAELTESLRVVGWHVWRCQACLKTFVRGSAEIAMCDCGSLDTAREEPAAIARAKGEGK